MRMEQNVQWKNEQPETHTARRGGETEAAGNGERERGGGTVKNGGNQQNRESLIQQHGEEDEYDQAGNVLPRQTDGGEDRDREHGSRGNVQMEASGRERGQKKKTVKGSQTTRMGEGGEIKPLTLVAVCGLLATLSASLPQLLNIHKAGRQPHHTG